MNVGAIVLCLIFAVVSLSSHSSRASGVWLQSLGVLPGGTNSYASDVSADGTVVVGSSDDRAFRWTATGGMQDLGLLNGATGASAYAVNADGTVIVGDSLPYPGRTLSGEHRAFRWTQAAGLQELGVAGAENSRATGVSADGSVVVGSYNYKFWYHEGYRPDDAFYWSDGHTTQIADAREIGGVSANGSIAFGRKERALCWSPKDGMQEMTFLEGEDSSYACAVNSDGSVVVGWSGSVVPNLLIFTENITGVLWTKKSGAQQLGFIPTDTTEDGSVIVGNKWSDLESGATQQAVIWTETGGMQNLEDYLRSVGVGLEGWTLEEATAISSSGTAVVGNGVYKGFRRAFAATGLSLALPAITSGAFKAGSAVGKAFSYKITANNSPSTFQAIGLPAGLKVNATTGVISGRPAKAGKFNVTISANNAGTGTASATLALNVAKGSQTITFNPRKTQAFKKNHTFTLSATASSKLRVRFNSDKPNILSIKGNKATIRDKGKVTVTASQEGNANYRAAKTVPQTVTIK